MNNEQLKAGFIGLGAMGEPMARRLAQSGHLASVWNRTREKAERLAREFNINCAVTPEELAAQVDVVLICVSNDLDVLEIIDAITPGLKPKSIVVDMSTVSSNTAISVTARIRSCGAEFLDIPVTGGVEGAREGKLAMMVGGHTDVLETIRPILEAMGNRIVHIGDNGMGQMAKAVNQIMAAGINQAVTEALAFGVRSGLDMEKVIEVVASGAAGNWFLEKRGKSMIAGTFKPGFKLALHHKDLKICEKLAMQFSMTMPLTTKTRQEYEKLMNMGYGDEDISALYRLKSFTEN